MVQQLHCITPLILFQLLVINASHVFDVYRLVQYDKGPLQLGSRRVTVNHLASAFHKAPDSGASSSESAQPAPQRRGDLSRRIVVIHIKELAIQTLVELEARGAAGLLILLDKHIANVPSSRLQEWKSVEQHLLSKSWEIPVYFTYVDSELKTMLADLKGGAAGSSEKYHLVVSGSDASPIGTVTGYNFQGWHYTQATSGHSGADVESMPTVAIVAPYDAFTGSPGLSYGVDFSGSGVITVLELGRIFARLYDSPRTQPNYNILLVLTAGASPLNYQGAKHWVKSLDARAADSLEFVLCLDSLSNHDENLYLHVSKPAKTPLIATLYENFENTAKHMGIPFSLVHKKINISDPTVYWQHEQFAKKKQNVLAVTLSGRSEPGYGSIFDTTASINRNHLRRNIKYVLEVVGKHIYNRTDRDLLSIAAQSLALRDSAIDAWLEYLTSQSRVVPYLNKESPVLQQIERALGSHCTDVKRIPFNLDSTHTFYQSPIQSQMTIYQVKPFTFDIFLTLAIGVYLSIFYITARIVSADNWREVFSRK